jgi:hypothetical protein
MESSASPLKYPDGYPPVDGWNRFFLGVRWLGPDTSFFKRLRDQQAGRTAEQMNCWGGGLRQTIAERISEQLSKELKWASSFFFPEDSFQVVCHGPSVESYDPDVVLEDATNHTLASLSIVLPESFWHNEPPVTFGEFVDRLLVNPAPNLPLNSDPTCTG